MAGGVPGCGPESDCDRVLNSRWSYALGLPVSVFAIPVYLAGLVLARKQRVNWRLLTPVAMLVLSAALWFVGLQVFVIRAFCKFCMVAHVGGVVAALLLLKNTPLPLPRIAISGALAVAATTLLVAAQQLGPERGPIQMVSADPGGPIVGEVPPVQAAPARETTAAAETSPVVETPAAAETAPVVEAAPAAETASAVETSPAQIVAPSIDVAAVPAPIAPATTNSQPVTQPVTLTIIDGEVTLDLTKVPVSGPLSAPKRMAKLFDFTCHHCRDLHHLLHDFREKNPSTLVIAALPLPLDSACNPMVRRTAAAHANACQYAAFGLAVFLADPAKFEEYSDFVFAPPRPPELARARDFAAQLVGAGQFEQALQSPEIGAQIQRNARIYQTVYRKSRSGRLPQMYFERGASIGAIETREQLERILAENLGIGPDPAAAPAAN